MLRIEPERSKLYRNFLGLSALASGVSLWGAGFPLGVKAVLSSILGLYLFRLGKHRVLGARLDGSGYWFLLRPDGSEEGVTLGRSTFVSDVCIVLHLKAKWGWEFLPVFRDSVDPETFRRLRVYLTCARSEKSEEQDHVSGPT